MKFKIEDLVDVSNSEDFVPHKKGYFMIDLRKSELFEGTSPIIALIDGETEDFEYVREYTEPTITHYDKEYDATDHQMAEYNVLIAKKKNADEALSIFINKLTLTEYSDT
jgi:hypothetical protein